MRIKLYQLVLLVVIILIATAGFLSYNVTREIEIKVSLFNLSPQLSDLHKWQKWNHVLFGKNGKVGSVISGITADGKIIDIKVNSPASFTIKLHKNNRIAIQHVILLPQKNDNTALVNWSGQETGFNCVLGRLIGHDVIEEQLCHLKTFAENPDSIYGFSIRIVEVTDRLLCITQKVVDKDSVLTMAPKMLSNLKAFLASKSITLPKNYYYLSYAAVGSKEELTVGLPIDKNLPAQQGFRFLKFPADGRLLVGKYKGDYKNLHLIYKAMDKYMDDNHLTKVAQVLEAYPFNADFKKPLKVQVTYPIY